MRTTFTMADVAALERRIQLLEMENKLLEKQQKLRGESVRQQCEVHGVSRVSSLVPVTRR